MFEQVDELADRLLAGRTVLRLRRPIRSCPCNRTLAALSEAAFGFHRLHLGLLYGFGRLAAKESE